MIVALTEIGVYYCGARIMESDNDWYLADPEYTDFSSNDGIMRIELLPFKGNA